jgi:pimeloyl-ACP methyl ester carboxylesterase
VRRTTPRWILAVLLFLAAAIAHESWPRDDALLRERVRALTVEHDPRRMSARELRSLPGVGHELALALERARDDPTDPRPLFLEDVPGIGPVRAQGIRAWCAARGLDVDPPPRGRGGERALSWRDVRAPPPSLVRRRRPRRLPRRRSRCERACGARRGCSRRRAGNAHERGGAGGRLGRVAGGLRACARAARRSAARARSGARRRSTVLLLHGARFTARTWDELGTLAELARAGWHAVALDWPGYGSSPRWDGEPDPAMLIARACDELECATVALVAPSMSGRLAFAFVDAHPERAAGLVAIAPANADEVRPAAWPTPTLLLWGERDDVVPLATGRALAGRLAGARLEVFPGASHPCYLDDPARFHALLLQFLDPLAPARR